MSYKGQSLIGEYDGPTGDLTGKHEVGKSGAKVYCSLLRVNKGGKYEAKSYQGWRLLAAYFQLEELVLNLC